MRKLIIVVLMITFFVSCDRRKENNENSAITVYNESMKIHDEVMPRMDEMYKLQEKLKAFQDSLLIDSIANVEKIAIVRGRLTALQVASKDMMDWMHNIKDVPRSTPPPGHERHATHQDKEAAKQADSKDMLKVQQDQKVRIEAVKFSMEKSIQEAKEILNPK